MSGPTFLNVRNKDQGVAQPSGMRQGGSAGQGWLEDGIVACPCHGATFDVRTGGH